MDDDVFNDFGYEDEQDIGAPNSPRNDDDSDLLISNNQTTTSNFNNVNNYLGMEDRFKMLDWHLKIDDDEGIVKRRKIEDIQNIVASVTLRIKQAKLRHKRDFNLNDNGDLLEETSPKNHLMKYPPMNGLAWFGVSSADTVHRAYLGIRSKPLITNKNLHIWDKKEANASKFARILDEVQTTMRNEMFDLLAPKQLTLSQFSKPSQQLGNEPSTSTENNDLWVEKYSPKNFFDLLTEDEPNRLTILWLRLWDEYVFHKKFNYDSLCDKDKKFLEIEERKGIYMPKQKILMLNGPPGCGKSTLATIAAKQAGYKPFVINVSEIHNLVEFKAKIEDASNLGAIDSHFKTSENKRPNCIIIDGIEYATNDIVRFLSDWFTKDTRDILKRPIICTSNNMYVQNLKQLRINCLIIKITGLNKKRLFQRIQKICNEENVKIGSVELDELTRFSCLDIRLCINTLQFLYNSTKKGVRRNKSSEIPSGHERNSDVSIFEALTAIMTLDSHVDKNGKLLPLFERCQYIQHLMYQRNDLDRFFNALFHNLSDVLKLTNVQHRKASEYFVLADLNHSLIYSKQNFSLLRYQGFIAAAFHLCVAVHVSRRLNINMSFMISFKNFFIHLNSFFYGFNDRQREFNEIVRTIRISTLKNANILTLLDLVLTVLPLIYNIIVPPVKPINACLHTGQDVDLIKKIVQVMVAFRLTYVLKYDENGALYCFDPPIDMLTCITSDKKDRVFLSNATKKYIAHQIELSSIRGTGDDTIVQRMETNKQPLVSYTPLVSKKKDKEVNFIFKYNQGSSQAIRRNIRISALGFH